MRAVHVGIGHDDDLVVARVLDREIILDARADRRDDRPDLLVRQHLVDARLLDVDDLAAQRQDRLELPVAPLLGGAAGGVALDEVDLAQPGSLSEQSASLPGRLPTSSADFLRVRSRALRAASRARAADTAFSTMMLADSGCSSRYAARTR